jgi:hypothetical protein
MRRNLGHHAGQLNSVLVSGSCSAPVRTVPNVDSRLKRLLLVFFEDSQAEWMSLASQNGLVAASLDSTQQVSRSSDLRSVGDIYFARLLDTFRSTRIAGLLWVPPGLALCIDYCI